MSYLPDHEQARAKKPNRRAIQERRKRRYKIAHESGRSTKEIWRRKIERSQELRKKNA